MAMISRTNIRLNSLYPSKHQTGTVESGGEGVALQCIINPTSTFDWLNNGYPGMPIKIVAGDANQQPYVDAITSVNDTIFGFLSYDQKSAILLPGQVASYIPLVGNVPVSIRLGVPAVGGQVLYYDITTHLATPTAILGQTTVKPYAYMQSPGAISAIPSGSTFAIITAIGIPS